MSPSRCQLPVIPIINEFIIPGQKELLNNLATTASSLKQVNKRCAYTLEQFNVVIFSPCVIKIFMGGGGGGRGGGWQWG